MKDNKYTRKVFLKKAGLASGAVIIGSQLLANTKITATTASETLNESELLFLKEYATWLKEFNRFVHLRHLNPTNLENNKRLMVLSAEAETRKPKLELLMQKPAFAQSFNHITQDITNNINE